MVSPVASESSAANTADVPSHLPNGKLAKSAQEFESILLSSWMAQINNSSSDDSGSRDPASDTVRSLGSQAMAEALAARGGIGIAKMLIRNLRDNQTSQPGKILEGPLHINRVEISQQVEKIVGNSPGH